MRAAALTFVLLLVPGFHADVRWAAGQASVSAQGTQADIGPQNRGALTAWRSGSTDKIVLNFSNLPADGRAAAESQLLNERLSENLTVGHFVPEGAPTTGNRDIIIKRQVVDGIEKLNSAMRSENPDAKLVWASGYRTPPEQLKESGSIRGPHVRGNAVDITFDVPEKSSRDSAVLTAQTAYKQGVKGIALDSNDAGTSYSAHVDFVRQDGWYADQVRKTEMRDGKEVRTKSYSTSNVSWLDGIDTSSGTTPSRGAPPPPPPGRAGAAAPSKPPVDPGGVLLDRAADILGDLGVIVGATFDARTNQVVLIGKSDISLPPFERDDLAIAVRAMKSGEPLGVSIDPTDDPRQMQVRYFGGAARTALGNTMFEADRVLKILGLGIDNVTRAPVRSGVPGFQTVVNLESSGPLGDGGGANYRFWFRPKRLEMQRTVGGNAVRFTKTEIECLVVKNESSARGTAAQRFVDHLNAHFDEFAMEYPSLRRLQQLAQVVGIAYWLRERGLDIDLAGFDTTAVDTPNRTPAVTATGRKRESGDLFWTTSITGGVDLSVAPTYVADTDRAAANLSALEAISRPSDTRSGGWDFDVDGESFAAVALPVRARPVAVVRLPTGIKLAAPTRPTVTSFVLNQDGATTTMTLDGFNFGLPTATSRLTLDGAAVSARTWTDTRISIQLPYATTEQRHEIVIARGGNQSVPVSFVAAPNPAGIIRRIRGAQYGALPPLSAVGGAAGGQTAVRIGNQTPYPLRICLVGPTVECRVVPTNTSTGLDLRIGSYEVGVDALAGLVLPLYSQWQIERGRTYEMILRLK